MATKNGTAAVLESVPEIPASPSKTISIPELQIIRLELEIVGLTPLLAHRFGESAIQQIQDGQSGAAKVKKPPREPAKEFEESIYRQEDGSYGFPSTGLRRAIVSAGQRFASEKGTELLGAFSFMTELMTLHADAPHMRTDRVVLAGMSRTTSLAYRPEFWPWSCTVTTQLNGGFLSLSQFLNLVRLAGFSVGVGDWRVEKKGIHGQFEVGQVVQL